MKAPSRKIELAATTDEGRPKLMNVYLEDGGERLVAADGWILAVIPAHATEDDKPGPIPSEVFEFIRKVRGRGKDLEIGLTEKEVVVGSARFERPGPMPNDMSERFKYNIKKAEETFKAPSFRVALSVGYLHRLASAICDDSRLDIILYFTDDPESPVAVKSARRGEGFGLIMPVSVKGYAE